MSIIIFYINVYHLKRGSLKLNKNKKVWFLIYIYFDTVGCYYQHYFKSVFYLSIPDLLVLLQTICLSSTTDGKVPKSKVW